MNVRRICGIGLFAAVMVVCSWITVPGPVPFTLQTFAVFAAAKTLGGADAFFAVLTHIALGLIGLPVFSNFNSGVGVLLGVTGGYLIAFLFIPLIMLIFEKRGKLASVLSQAAGLLVMYTFGSVWYVLVYMSRGDSKSFAAAVMTCVVPFVVPDAIKVTLANAVAGRIKKRLP